MQTRVAFSRCSSYDAVEASLARLLHLIGGMEAFVKPGQSVLVKPNLLTDSTPEKAVTTHPEVVRAVVRAVRAAGAKPWIGDSPSNAVNLQRVWERTGMEAVCREEDVPLVSIEKAGSEEFDVSGIKFRIAREVLRADAIVSIPKVKTHVLTGLTCGVKNLYGTVPGYQKTVLHKLYPRRDEFADMLVAVYSRVKPVLTIADGVVGMEGNGPSGGAAIPLDFLAASADAVALDVVLARLLKLDFDDVSYLPAARRSGIGETEWERIEVVGESLRSLAVRFQKAHIVPMHRIPAWMSSLLISFLWHRPLLTEKCVLCGQCVKACPTEALAQEKGRRPVLNAAACIGCCCCHEVCLARAVEMQASPLFRMIQAVRGHG